MSAPEHPGDPQQQFDRARALFREVRKLSPAARQAALQARTNDQSLIEQVIALCDALSDETGRDDFEARIGSALAGVAADALGPHSAVERIGAYRILREIGRGGMGIVYEAEQEEPRRRVALKVVATGLASPSLLERFRLEAHALGRLDHPGIARILEAGTFEAGAGPVPFFAMDLIDGQPISRALADAPVEARLSLLADVADAVHHAHLRGVVHRDLKPANVLVDESGRARVVDFGIARLLDPEDDAASPRTASGHLLGTPAYMSPEQALGDPAVVDARSDIHALGALAYEVLSGKPPVDPHGRSLDEQLREVREVPPRRLGPADGVPRDVGVVLAMALEKDPSRRHASAAAFAEDLRRARDGRPVSGRAPSTAYQLSRFAARHPLGTGLTLASLALLVTSTAVIAVLLGRSLAAEARAAHEARIARDVTAFLVDDVFGAVSPEQRDSETLTVDGLVDRAAADALARFRDDPTVAREVLRALAEVDLNLGRYAEARRRLEEIDALGPTAQRRPVGNDPARASREEALLLVRAAVAVANDDPATGLEIAESVLARRRARLGPDDPQVLAVARVVAAHRSRVDFDAGIAALRETLADHERVFGADALPTIEVADDIALRYTSVGRDEQALPFAERVASALPSLAGPDGWRTLQSLVTLGEIHRSLEHYDAALANFERARAGFERRGTPRTSFHRISLEANMGLLHMETGDFAAAEPYLDRAIADGIEAGEVGTAPFETLRHNYGALKMLLGQHDAAEQILADVLARRIDLLGADDFETLMTRGLLGENRRRAGRPAQAVGPLTQAWEGLVAMFSADHELARRTASRLEQVFDATGDAESAARWRSRAGGGDRPPER